MLSSHPRWDVAETPNPFVPTISVRQVVAHNLARARKERGLTQDELGERLKNLTGKEWSRATVSAAESGWDSRAQMQRIRHFDVNEVAAFALALRVPLSWFFLPPNQLPSGDPLARDEPLVTVATNDSLSKKKVITSEVLVWLALSPGDSDDPDDLMASRVKRDGWRSHSAATPEDGVLAREILRRLETLEQAGKSRQESS